MINIAKAWFLGFFEPGNWQEIEDKLGAISEREKTVPISQNGMTIPISPKAMADMADLLAAASEGPGDLQGSPDTV